MKVVHMAMLILCVSISLVAAKTRVFILSGQSNMVGVGKVSELTEDQRKSHTIKNSAIYVSVQKRPLLFLTPIQPGNTALTPEYDGKDKDSVEIRTFGPELGIAKVLRQRYPFDKLILIKVAMGGTILCYDPNYPNLHWLTSGDMPSALMLTFFAKVQEAFGKITDVGYSIDGFFWMQGEGDGDKVKSAVYSKNSSGLLN